jgi:hypothetical protein
MLVPKYERPRPRQAERVTGVAGQPMTFKIPGGALSQADVAKAASFDELASEAGKWGAAVYEMHRASVVAKEVAQGNAALSEVAIQAQRQDLSNPEWAEQGGSILGYYNYHANRILNSAGSSSIDPLTRKRITANLAGTVSRQTQTLNNYYAARLVDQRNAEINANQRESIRIISNYAPADWDGNPETLPNAARELFEQTVKEQLDAANTGIKDAVQAGNAISDLRSEITQHAVYARISALQTTEQVEQLQDLLDDPNNFRHLKLVVRKRVVDALQRKHQSFLSKEFRDETRARTLAEKQLRIRQSQRATVLHTRISRARETGNPQDMPTWSDINYLAEEDGGRGLKVGHQQMFLNLIDDVGPTVSDGPFVSELYDEVGDIAAEGLSQEDTREAINAVIERSALQIAKGTLSRITIQDRLSFLKYANSVANKERDTSEENRFRNLVRLNSVPHDKFQLLVDPTDVFTQGEALRFYQLQIGRGAEPHEAFMLAMERVGITPESKDQPPAEVFNKGPKPFYPVGVPGTVASPVGLPGTVGSMDLPDNTDAWEMRHVDAARLWVKRNKSQDVMGRTPVEKRDRYQRLMEEFLLIERYIERNKQ